ncbi:MAG TPA: DUF1365 domain-containing protein [Drouetiella sp.]
MANLTSCLYECDITHQRLQPKKHRVEHKMFSFYLDLDELNDVSKFTAIKTLPLIGINRKALYALFDKDHFEDSSEPLKEKVLDFVKKKAPDLQVQKINALCNLRFLNYVFNPITVFFCFSKDMQILCAVAEVGNTFGEKKPYLIRAEGGSNILRDLQPKNFYVSPFIDLDTDVAFNLKVPGEQLTLSVTTEKAGTPVLAATMTGKKCELEPGNLIRLTFKYPFVTFFVIGAIHFHALLLWIKKVPFIRKEENPQLQTEVLRPIQSLRESQSQTGEAYELATNANR